MKIANIELRNYSYLLNNLRNFNEICRKDVNYDNIKSHKKPGFHPLFRRNIFRKTTGEVKLISSPAVLGLTLLYTCGEKCLQEKKLKKYLLRAVFQVKRNSVNLSCSLKKYAILETTI